MPFWVRDFFGSPRVIEMTGDCRAVYALSLLASWNENGRGLPSETKQLLRVLGISRKLWNATKQQVLEMYVERNGRLYNERLDAELRRASAIRESKRAAAKETNKTRWKGQDDVSLSDTLSDRSAVSLSDRSRARTTTTTTTTAIREDPKSSPPDGAFSPPDDDFHPPSGNTSRGLLPRASAPDPELFVRPLPISIPPRDPDPPGGEALVAQIDLVAQHFAQTVWAARGSDQQRTRGRRSITQRLLEGEGVERLRLACDRYALELGEESRPYGAHSFFSEHWQDYLAPDWVPPAKVDSLSEFPPEIRRVLEGGGA